MKYPLIAFFILLSWAAASASATADPLLATLGRTPLRESDFQRFVEGMFAPQERESIRTNAQLRGEALEAYFDLTTLAAKARCDGLDRTVTFRKARELREMKYLARMMTERERERFMKAAQVTEPELRDFYDRHPERFQVAPNFTIRQVLVYVRGNPAFPDRGHEEATALAIAETALKRLRAGETWDAVAKAYSDDKASGERGGLLEGQFGYFPREMEAAIRTQEFGKPGEIVKTDFGCHVLQVERRVLETQRRPFAEVKDVIAPEVSNEKISRAHREFMEPVLAAVRLKEAPLAAKDTFVLNPPGIKTNDVLATLDGRPVYQSDFEWFARDAFRMEQREQAFSRPGARVGMVKSFLNMKALELRARQLGLDGNSEFQAISKVEEMKLLGEFLQERDRTTPWMLPGTTEEARTLELKKYLKRLRQEVELRIEPNATDVVLKSNPTRLTGERTAISAGETIE